MIENKVENSGLVQIDPKQLIQNFSVKYLDISTLFGDKPFLVEKEFRLHLKTATIELEESQCLGIYCSTDIILPKWAFMLVVSHFSSLDIPTVVLAPNSSIEEKWSAIRTIYPYQQHLDEKIIVKGCSSFDDQEFLSDFSRELTPIAKTLMFGEACSAVPINKKRKV